MWRCFVRRSILYSNKLLKRTLTSTFVMATEAETLQQNLQQADLHLTALRQQVEVLRQDAVAKSCSADEKRLKAENELLRQEVERIKTKLIQQEIRNGVKQIYVRKPVAACKEVVTNSNETAETAVNSTETSSRQPEKKQSKAKKTEKKGNEQTTSSKAAQPETLDASSLDMRIGLIVNAKKHPDADSLYVEEVDVGEATNRTIISGLVKHVPLEQMQNRFAIFLLNLKPATMRGIASQGMIMCASSPDKVEIITPPSGVVPGEKVQVVGYTGTPLQQLNPKKKHFEQIQPDLRINEAGFATYKGALWEVSGKGNCRAPTMTNSAIR